MSSGIRLSQEEALKRINERCLEANIEFLGFDNEENAYRNDVTKLRLKCNKCGFIWNTLTYGKFIRVKRGCKNCCVSKAKTKKEITDDINKLCKQKDFTFLGFKGDFKGVYSKLRLRCNKCGKEWETTTYVNFKKIGRNSHSCGRNNPSSMHRLYNIDEIVKSIKSKLVSTSLEFMSFDEKGYIGRANTHVLLKCNKCGEINTFSYNYLMNNGIKCKHCSSSCKFSNEEATRMVEEKCKRLNYSFLGFLNKDDKYKGKNTYLILQCNKCGHIWKTTTFASFRQNIIKCMGCTNSWKMEKEVECFLRSKNIEYIEHCRNNHLPWLTNKISLSLDFYLPKHNIGIECQGRQHFEPVFDFGGEKAFQENLERDKRKLLLCKENGVKLLYYDSEHNHKEFLGEKVYNNETELLNKITSYGKEN